MTEKSDYFFAVLDLNLSNGTEPGMAMYKTVVSYEKTFYNLDCPAEPQKDKEVRTHRLKTWPCYFQPILDGTKRFDLRENDRDFRVGDILELAEYDPEVSGYTGRFLSKKVTFLIQGIFGLPEDVCVMSVGDSTHFWEEK